MTETPTPTVFGYADTTRTHPRMVQDAAAFADLVAEQVRRCGVDAVRDGRILTEDDATVDVHYIRLLGDGEEVPAPADGIDLADIAEVTVTIGAVDNPDAMTLPSEQQVLVRTIAEVTVPCPDDEDLHVREVQEAALQHAARVLVETNRTITGDVPMILWDLADDGPGSTLTFRFEVAP
jgi:hypothetical protein